MFWTNKGKPAGALGDDLGPGLVPVFALILALVGCLGISGCLFDSGTTVDIPKPAALNPEHDLFSVGSPRLFSVNEGIIRAGKDTTFEVRTLTLSSLGDTLIGGLTKNRVAFATSPAPAAALTLLGLNATRISFDTVAIPDPGPGLRFPDSPYVGWSLDTTVGALRYKRALTAVQTVRAAGQNQRCWVFSDSTYWNGAGVSKGTYWMGATGLVKHRLEWKPYAPSTLTGGTFWREVRAEN